MTGRFRIPSWLRWGVSLFLLAVLLGRVDRGALVAAWEGIHWGWMFLAGGTYLLTQVLSAWRWAWLLRPLGKRASAGWLLRLYFLGMFWNQMLPTSIGGDAIRAWVLGRHLERPASGWMSVFLDRWFGLVALGWVGLVGTGWAWDRGGFQPLLGGGVLLGVTGISLGLTLWCVGRGKPEKDGEVGSGDALPKGSLWQRLQESLQAYRGRWGVVLGALGLSLGIQALNGGMYGLLGMALGIHLSPGVWLWVYALATLASLLPLTMNGWGIREATLIYLLHPWGIPEAQALALSLSWGGLTLVLSLPGAFLLPLGMSRSRL